MVLNDPKERITNKHACPLIQKHASSWIGAIFLFCRTSILGSSRLISFPVWLVHPRRRVGFTEALRKNIEALAVSLTYDSEHILETPLFAMTGCTGQMIDKH
jgi:hypothetical protein